MSDQVLDVIDNMLKAQINTLQFSQQKFNTSGRYHMPISPVHLYIPIYCHSTLFCRLLAIVDQLADSYPVMESPTIILRDTFITVIYSDVDPASFAGQTVTALVGSNFEFQSLMIQQVGLEPSDLATGSITIPQTLFNGLSLGSRIRMVYNMFLNEGLFVRRQQYLEQNNRTYSKLASIVMAARVAGGIHISDLHQPVEQSYYKNPVHSCCNS